MTSWPGVTVTASLASQAWRKYRACNLADPRMFTTPGLESQAISTYCANCPVDMECLGRALDQPRQYGVAGGRTQFDRARLIGIIAAAERAERTGKEAE